MALDQLKTDTVHLASPPPIASVSDSHGVVGDYTLTRRIGVGGYGEVWQAVGPGGLHKAVKILHGRYDGRQADAEQKSLEKMRAVRHPFLLNIERIEVIDGRLIIVTELAERSLEDRYQQLRHENLAGIPREELLTYLREAADALDFLYENHHLQHLDIKPANLLCQGNHIKVADFGLIKEVDAINESLVNGFTPLYAAPELIEGKPSRNSDQYSLAVVYQVLLTGEPPFAGRNAAQIVAQHLNSKPDLSPLPPADHPAMARALAKRPQARFDTCRQFIDSLLAHRTRSHRPSARAAAPSVPGHSGAGATPQAATSSSSVNPTRSRGIPSRPLPALSCQSAQGIHRPTLFVGVGGLGGGVLLQLRQRLYGKFGPDADLPSLPFLYLDADSSAISTALAGPGAGGLRESEVMPLHLRSPAEYRQSAAGLSDWLSRRWLCNIPRSGLPEGIRPLGRLAFTDHCSAIRVRLRDLLVQAIDDQSMTRTSQQTSLPLQTTGASVFVVASISGGTGSGMVLDLGYLLRDLLAELNLPDDGLCGLLLHCQPGTYTRGKVPCANAVACLRELQRFSTRGLGYPGDRGCRLPSTDRAPFEYTYLVHLGDDEAEPGLVAGTEQVAEYLFRSAAAPEAGFFREHRAQTRDSQEKAAATIGLRSFALVCDAPSTSQETPSRINAVCRALLRQWQQEFALAGKERRGTSPAIAQWAQNVLRRVRLEAPQLVALAGDFMKGDQGRVIEHFAVAVQQALAQRPPAELTFARVTQLIERGLIEEPGTTPAPHHPATILAQMQDCLDRFTQEAASIIRAEVLAVGDGPGARLTAVSDAIAAVACQLDQTIAGLATVTQGLQGDMAALRSALEQKIAVSVAAPTGWDNALVQEVRAVCHKCCVLKTCSLIYSRVSASAAAVRKATLKLTDAVEHVRRCLRDCEQYFPTDADSEQVPSRSPRGTANEPAEIEALARALDTQARSGGHLRLFTRLLSERGTLELRDLLNYHARQLPRNQAATSGQTDRGTRLALSPTGELAADLPTHLEGLGGQHRVLAVLPNVAPEDTWQQALTARFRDCVTVNRSVDLLVCCETAALDLESVMGRLVESQPDVIETASQLHTRIDVDWRKLS